METRVKIYVDGACLVNPGGPGSHAVLIVPEDEIAITEKAIFFSGGSTNTTNNIQELNGVLEALKWLKENGKTNTFIYSDSKYCVNGANDWMFKWAKKNWKNGEVKNVALWKQIFGLYQETKSRLEWVRGHNGNCFNEFCDSLAAKTANEIANGMRAKYAQVQVGELLIQIPESGSFSPRYTIMQKFEATSTIILKPENDFKKSKPAILSSVEFNEGNFLKV